MKNLISLKKLHLLKKNDLKNLKGGGIIEMMDDLEVDID